MNTCCFGEELLFWIQKFSRFPLYVKQQYYSVYWKKGEGKREKRICYTEDLSKWLLSISVVFIIFFIFICIFLFVNSPCEQRQGLAVLSSTTPWLSSKNRANHHDGHTEKWKKKKKKRIKPWQHPWTASHYHTQTCTNTLLQVPCTSKTRIVMLHMDPNVGGRKEEEEEEEEGGVTGLILQPLDDDLRSGRGTELDPSPATKKMENKK